MGIVPSSGSLDTIRRSARSHRGCSDPRFVRRDGLDRGGRDPRWHGVGSGQASRPTRLALS